MYSAIVLEDILEVLQITNAYPELELVAQRGICSLDCLVASSEYMHFNDCVNENEIGADQLATLAGRMFPNGKISSIGAFNIDGYVGYKDDRQHMVCDFAPVILGPQGGHVHCDAASIEWYYLGEKVLTNSGVYEYTAGERCYARSTAAHSTLSVEGYEQSEVWGAFRLGRTAHVELLEEAIGLDKYRWRGMVRYFDRGRPLVHLREVELIPSGLRISDQLDAKSHSIMYQAVVYFHLHLI